jgi:hypothetical protein
MKNALPVARGLTPHAADGVEEVSAPRLMLGRWADVGTQIRKK